MRVLAVDTSQLQATVALCEAGKLVKFSQGATSVAHSEALLPLITNVVESVELASIDAFAVGIGPGSFTGIRIGCATIKSLAQVFQKQVFPFSSLKALALSESEDLKNTVSLVQAYQGLVFSGRIDAKGHWTERAETLDEFFSVIQSEKSSPVEICIAGNARNFFKTKLSEIENEYPLIKIKWSAAEFIQPQGIERVVKMAEKAEYMHYNAVHANYIRASQAEIKLESLLAKK